MKIYADTSVLIAWFHPGDVFAVSVRRWCEARDAQFCWNPFLRLELRHTLRRLRGKYARVGWDAYRASETARILLLDTRRVSDFLEFADELSTKLSSKFNAGTWDCLHVAAALRSECEVFVTCDAAQAEAAKAASEMPVHLFK
jgi:predicted nucleic acid-binding protein